MAPTYYVKALWDADANVWVSQSDIPGLVIEADTLGEFEALIGQLAPELLAANVGSQSGAVSYVFTAESRRELQLA
ncbi:MAG: DUF1902 domain-containing protein [Caulobacteraceae bacterium]|nr:DUF1902 domain-containing protein [Caulobacter sp.]